MVLVWGRRYAEGIIEGYKIRDFTLTERVLTQFRVVLYYVTLVVWPHPSRLNLDYDFPTSHGLLNPPLTLVSILIVMGLIGYGVWSGRKRPLVSYFIFWYFGNLLIESSIFPLEMVYEHRLYLPIIGPIVLFVAAVVKGWEKIRSRLRLRQEQASETGTSLLPRMDYPVWGFFLLSVIFLAWGTHVRNEIWKSPITVWEDCIKKSPNKYRPYYNLGLDYYWSGRYEQAINLLKTANRLKPEDTQTLNNLGAAYRKAGQNQQAIETYREALRLDRKQPEASNNLGLAYYHSARYSEAIEAFNEAIRLKPENEEYYYNLGVACSALGNHSSAIDAYDRSIRIRQDYVQARFNLAVSYLILGKRDLALHQYGVLKGLDRERAEKLLTLINRRQ